MKTIEQLQQALDEQLQQALDEQLAYSHTVAHHLVDALQHIEYLDYKVNSWSEGTEPSTLTGTQSCGFNYEEAAKAVVQSDEDALRGIKANAILSVTKQGYNFEPDSFHSDVVAVALIEAYANKVREGL